jgi:hypothetical protein
MDVREQREYAALWEMLERQEDRSREMRDLLIRLETRVEHLVLNLATVTEGAGLPRCAERGQRLGALERRLEQLLGRFWWFGATAAAAMVSLAVKTVWELAAG